MAFEKTRAFVFVKLAYYVWSSLRINFPNLRFKDLHFFRLIMDGSRTKKSLAKSFFARPKIFSFENFYEDFEFFSENYGVRSKILSFVTTILCS